MWLSSIATVGLALTPLFQISQPPVAIAGRTSVLASVDSSAFSDDWIRIMLDTFDDQRQAYVFYVNPIGIQTDGLWIEGMERRSASSVSIDFNPDFVWESDGRVTHEGWVAEIKIPYTSLRFRQVSMQDCGVQVAREVRRSGFKQSWAPLTQNISNTLAQSGRLLGLQDLHPRRLMEINPVMTGKRVGQTVDETYSGQTNTLPIRSRATTARRIPLPSGTTLRTCWRWVSYRGFGSPVTCR